MTPSAHAARRASAAAGLLCTAALAAACGSSSSPATSQASATGSTAQSSAPAAPSSAASASSASSTGSAAAAACASSSLSATVNTSPGGAAAGSTYYPLNFTNTSSSPCTLFGYPGVSFVTGPAGSQIGDPASRNPAVTAATVTLAPGAVAHATLQVVDALNYSKSDCAPVTAHWLRVFPPGQFTALYVKFSALTCSAKLPAKLGSPLTVDAVKGGDGKPGQGL
ncbi:MAG TPA: DUF4232 domain-containing protein [Streptosporangiaceae bacterium]|nr:DUF4232 domain-containing protein [Streptosporangiaceae bacterium]